MKSPWIWMLVMVGFLLIWGLAVLMPALAEARNSGGPRERAFIWKLAGVATVALVLSCGLSFFSPEGGSGVLLVTTFWLIFFGHQKRKKIRQEESRKD